MKINDRIKEIKFLIETYEKSKNKESFTERVKELYLLGQIENDVYNISVKLFKNIEECNKITERKPVIRSSTSC